MSETRRSGSSRSGAWRPASRAGCETNPLSSSAKLGFRHPILCVRRRRCNRNILLPGRASPCRDNISPPLTFSRTDARPVPSMALPLSSVNDLPTLSMFRFGRSDSATSCVDPCPLTEKPPLGRYLVPDRRPAWPAQLPASQPTSANLLVLLSRAALELSSSPIMCTLAPSNDARLTTSSAVYRSACWR